MIDTAKREEGLKNLRNVCEQLLGVEPDDVSEAHILGCAPDSMKETDPKRALYLGADQIDMMKFMLYIEQEFNKEVDDTLFVPRKDVIIEEMWRERPISDLLDFCVDTLMKD
jgi:acyl carrier protein